MKVFYFSGTGNSMYVAKRIGGEPISVIKMIKENKFDFEDEAIGFVVPCYCYAPAQIMIDFIKRANFTANYYFVIVTYGSHCLGSLGILEKVFKTKNLKFNYTSSLLMIANYLPFHKMEIESGKIESKEIEENLAIIVKEIAQRKIYRLNKGYVMNFASKVMSKSYKFVKQTMVKQLKADETCTACKVCQKACPIDNIKFDGTPKFGDKCIACFRCIHICPHGSIHIKSEKSGARYINSNTTLLDFLESNGKGD